MARAELGGGGEGGEGSRGGEDRSRRWAPGGLGLSPWGGGGLESCGRWRGLTQGHVCPLAAVEGPLGG